MEDKFDMGASVQEELDRIKTKYDLVQPDKTQEDWAEMLEEYARRAKYAARFDQEDWERWVARVVAVGSAALWSHEERYNPCRKGDEHS